MIRIANTAEAFTHRLQLAARQRRSSSAAAPAKRSTRSASRSKSSTASARPSERRISLPSTSSGPRPRAGA
jgi:hypothetical protein